MNKINEKYILDKGFYEVEVPRYESNSVDKMFYKSYRDKDGNKRNSLEIVHYDLTHPTTGADLSGYEIKGQVYLTGSHNAVNLNFLEPDIEEAEMFIDKLFEAGLIENYE